MGYSYGSHNENEGFPVPQTLLEALRSLENMQTNS
jgi:hypothetical protein